MVKTMKGFHLSILEKCNVKRILYIFLYILFSVTISLADCPTPVGDVYTCTDSSVAEVQDCIDDANAASGGIVIIPGTATWTTTVSRRWSMAKPRADTSEANKLSTAHSAQLPNRNTGSP